MVWRWNESAAEGIHFCKWTDHTCISEVVSILTTSERRTRSWFCTDNLVVSLATEHLTDEWRSETTEVGTATGATDQDVWLDVILLHGCLSLQTDDGLMQENLVQH